MWMERQWWRAAWKEFTVSLDLISHLINDHLQNLLHLCWSKFWYKGQPGGWERVLPITWIKSEKAWCFWFRGCLFRMLWRLEREGLEVWQTSYIQAWIAWEYKLKPRLDAFDLWAACCGEREQVWEHQKEGRKANEKKAERFFSQFMEKKWKPGRCLSNWHGPLGATPSEEGSILIFWVLLIHYVYCTLYCSASLGGQYISCII